MKQTQSLGGGVIVPGTDIPNVGRFAILTDPQGAVFAIFSGAAGGHDGEPAIGEFSWHELATTDYKKAFEFYSALFGWDKQAEHDMGPMGVYFLFARNGRETGGIYNITPDMKMPPNWMQYVSVDSVDAAVERVKANGGKVLNGPMDVMGGDRIAQCMDPQGGVFARPLEGPRQTPRKCRTGQRARRAGGPVPAGPGRTAEESRLAVNGSREEPTEPPGSGAARHR